MKIRAIAKSPFKLLERTWLGDLAKIVRIAFTPLKDVKKDHFVRRHKLSPTELKAGIKDITTAKDLAARKKRVLEHDFRP